MRRRRRGSRNLGHRRARTAAALGAAAAVALAGAAAFAVPADWPADGRDLLDPSGALVAGPDAATPPAAFTVAFGCLPGEVCADVAPAAEPPAPSPVPLPAALVLLGAGMATLAMLLRGRRTA